jgi:hypothetical protein
MGRLPPDLADFLRQKVGPRLVREEVAQRNIEGPGDSLKDFQRGKLLAPLDLADVRIVHSSG